MAYQSAYVRRREIHPHLTPAWRRRIRSRRQVDLAMSSIAVQPVATSATTCLAVHPRQDRMLLAGGADCSLGLYDLDRRSAVGLDSTTRSTARADGGGADRRRSVLPIAHVGGIRGDGGAGAGVAAAKRHRHKNSVTTVAWYPPDPGLFLSGGMDGWVKLWDSSAFSVAEQFEVGEHVYCAAFQAGATQSHALIAVGTEASEIVLCDLNQGIATHRLRGHCDAISALAWSPLDEHVFASGGNDGTVRLWDVRRAGGSACFATLGMHRTAQAALHRSTHPAAAAPLSPRSRSAPLAHHGAVTALRFTASGRHLVSSGRDQQARVWDMSSPLLAGSNTLSHFAQLSNSPRRGGANSLVVAGSGDAATMYHACGAKGRDVGVYGLFDGELKQRLKGHFDAIWCSAYRADAQELITSGKGGLIATWRPAEDERGGGGRGGGADDWSDDEVG